MLWMFLIVGVIIAAFSIPGFGKAVLGIVSLILVLIIAAALWLLLANQQQAAEREAAKSRIRESEIELVDLRLGSGYGSSRTLLGRVRNRSPRYTLTELTLKLTMSDCIPQGECEIVAESEQTIFVRVPPGQARDLDTFVHFSGLGKPRGRHQWSYDVAQIAGK